MYRIVEGPIVAPEVVRCVSGAEVGAVTWFLGTVREENVGKRVLAVEYQAYPAMAEKVMRQIGEEMRRGFGPMRIAMVHRVGRLTVGEASVLIAVGASHRHEALGALAYAIERLKQAVPVWKREFYEDGSQWLEPNPIGPSAGEEK